MLEVITSYKIAEDSLDHINPYGCVRDNTSKKEYKFFHLSSFPSGYVILEYEEEPTDIMIYTSAKLCKEYSKYKNLKNIKVDWCQCDNLQKGEKVGEVYFKSNRKVRQNKV